MIFEINCNLSQSAKKRSKEDQILQEQNLQNEIETLTKGNEILVQQIENYKQRFEHGEIIRELQNDMLIQLQGNMQVFCRIKPKDDPNEFNMVPPIQLLNPSTSINNNDPKCQQQVLNEALKLNMKQPNVLSTRNSFKI